MSPAAAQQALSALQELAAAGERYRTEGIGSARLELLRRNIKRVRCGLVRSGFRVLGDAQSPVIPLMIYHPETLSHFSRTALEKHNLAIVVVGFPATPVKLGR